MLFNFLIERNGSVYFANKKLHKYCNVHGHSRKDDGIFDVISAFTLLFVPFLLSFPPVLRSSLLFSLPLQNSGYPHPVWGTFHVVSSKSCEVASSLFISFLHKSPIKSNRSIFGDQKLDWTNW